MKPTEALHQGGQSLWLDNITRELLSSGTLSRYIRDLSIVGLTSNPTIFDHAIKQSAAYDAAIRELLAAGQSGEQLFFTLALQDLTAAADLLRDVFERTAGVDGWVSLEVSPLLARDARSTLAEAKSLHARANRPNLYIKIPGTVEGLPAIEEAIFSGVPINVTLLFSPTQYLAAAEAYLRGIERRIAAGLSANVSSVASVFISRWDVAVAGQIPERLANTLGVAVGRCTYQAYAEQLASKRWHRAFNAGARPQRLLFASTGTKDPTVSEVLYVNELHAPLTVNTVPEKTLNAFAAHGEPAADWTDEAAKSASVLEEFRRVGIDIDRLGKSLQDQGAASFDASWNDLLGVISDRSESLRARRSETVS